MSLELTFLIDLLLYYVYYVIFQLPNETWILKVSYFFQKVVIDEVDNFLFRPRLGLRAKYYAVCSHQLLPSLTVNITLADFECLSLWVNDDSSFLLFLAGYFSCLTLPALFLSVPVDLQVNFLSQIRLSHKGDGPKAAKRLIDIYFGLFKVEPVNLYAICLSVPILYSSALHVPLDFCPAVSCSNSMYCSPIVCSQCINVYIFDFSRFWYLRLEQPHPWRRMIRKLLVLQ